MKRKINTDEKGKLIGNICMKLKFMAENEKKGFDYCRWLSKATPNY